MRGEDGCYHDVVLYSPLLEEEEEEEEESGRGVDRKRRRRRHRGTRAAALLLLGAAAAFVAILLVVLVPRRRRSIFAVVESGREVFGRFGGHHRRTPPLLRLQQLGGEDVTRLSSSSAGGGVSRLSHVGRAVLSELRYGTYTGIEGDLPNEGLGRTWGLDVDASMSSTTATTAALTGIGDGPIAGGGGGGGVVEAEAEDAKNDWLIYTPMNHLGERGPIAVPRSCDPAVDSDCHPDFFLPDCTRDPSICDSSGHETANVTDPLAPFSLSSPPVCRTVRSTVTGGGDPFSSQPRKLCVGHSDAMYDTLYDLLTSARRYVDVSSLDAPDGRFLAAFRNALSFLHNSGRTVQIRYLVGVYGFTKGVDEILSALTRDLPASSTTVSVSVGYWMDVHPKYDLSNIVRRQYMVNEGDGLSFNHAKIVAIDSKVVLTGGHNLRTGNFLTSSPIMDLSVLVKGRGVTDAAHRYLDVQWDHACRLVRDNEGREKGGSWWSWWKRWFRRARDAFGRRDLIRLAGVASFPTPTDRCPPPFVPVSSPSEEAAGGTTTMTTTTTTTTTMTSLPPDDTTGDGGAGADADDGSSSKGIPVIAVGRLGGLSSSSPATSIFGGSSGQQPPSLNRDQTSDRAIISMLRSATSTIKLSQQDLGPPGGFDAKKQRRGMMQIEEYWNLFGPHWTLIELCRALLRGVEVRVVLSSVSSPTSKTGDGDGGVGEEVGAAPEENYANGWTTDDVVYMVRWYLRHGDEFGILPILPPEDEASAAQLTESHIGEVTCRNLTVTTLRYNDGGADEWSLAERCPRRFDFDLAFFDPHAAPSTVTEKAQQRKRKKYADCDSMEARLFGLHTKLIVVDDIAFYVGSQNLYSTPLAEWGVVVDDVHAAGGVLNKFWDPLWEASSS